MIHDFEFESDRLKTVRLQKDDAEILFQIYSDREAMKYRGSRPIRSMEDAIEMVAEEISIENQVSKQRLGIVSKPISQIIGTLLISQSSNYSQRCEVGFSFGKAYWGNGFGQETLQSVEGELQTREEIEEIEAWCVRENIASIRIFEKAGYTRVVQNVYPQSVLFRKKF